MEHIENFEGFLKLNEELSELQKAYREYFKFMLSKYEVTSPAKLSPEKKSEFFDEIRKNWKKGIGAKQAIKKQMNESESEGEKIDYKDYKITIWPFHNPELDKNKSWGYQIFKDDNYVVGTKGPVGDFNKCESESKSAIDRWSEKK